MGYRSEVAFCLQVKEPEKFIALAKIDADDALKEMLDNMYYVDGADNIKFILFTHNYWKWYEDSERAFRKLVELAENYDEEFACRFARSGEEASDIEEEAYGDYGWDLEYPYVVRELALGVKAEELQKIIKEEEHATTS
jgi:hypothetical protein